MPSSVRGYLGIDNGTQRISIIFTDEKLLVLATGEGSLGFFMPDLPVVCYEQVTEHWDGALCDAMRQIHQQIPNMQVFAIGILGQMHGEVLVGESGNSLSPVQLWCDAQNEAEGLELTSLFHTKVPKWSTVS
jgi:sugar (pentulose or hexulose) kinase